MSGRRETIHESPNGQHNDSTDKEVSCNTRLTHQETSSAVKWIGEQVKFAAL